MCKNSLWFGFLTLCILSAPMSASTSQYEETVQKLFQRVSECNSELSYLKQKVQAISQQIDAQSVWPDPIFGVDYSNMPLSTPYPGNHPMSGIQLSLKQKFPFFGKANFRSDVARAKTRVAESTLVKEKNRILASISTAYLSLLLNTQLKEITKEHLQTVKSLRKSIESRYQVGKAKQFQLLRLNTLEQRIEDELFQLVANENESNERLKLAINCSKEITINREVQIPLPKPMKPEKQFLTTKLKNQSPALNEIQKKQDVETRRIKMFEREAFPDITTSFSFRFRSPITGGDTGENFISAGISVPIPFFWNNARFGSGVRASRSNSKALEHMYTARLEKDSRELKSQYIRWNRQVQKTKTYESQLIPAARKTLESALSSYSVSQAEFTDVYLAELELLDFEREAIKARAAATRASIAYHALVGNFTKINKTGGGQ